MKNFRNYQYQKILTKDGEIANGDYVIDELLLIRVKNGYLNDVTDEEGNFFPAIETLDGNHVEHWKNGVLHSENEPAVIDLFDGYKEWWKNGVKIQTATDN